MKAKILSLALAAMTALCFAACQPTPEEEYVAIKDTERMLERAAEGDNTPVEPTAQPQEHNAEEEKEPPADSVMVPQERYALDITGAEGRLRINVNALVAMPEGGAMPIYRVKAADFTQEQVSAFWNALCGGLEMWDMPDAPSKADLLNMIMERKKKLELASERGQASILDYISMLEKALETAPEAAEKTRADGTLAPRVLYADLAATQKIANYMGVKAYGQGIEFSVANNNDLTEKIEVAIESSMPGLVRTISPVRAASITYINDNNSAYTEGRAGFGYSPSILVAPDGETDAGMLEKTRITPAEAKALVQELLDKTDCGMAIDSVYLQDDEQFGHEDFIVRPAKHWAYHILCVREIEGVPCAYISGTSNAGTDAVAPSWAYEQMTFLVNDEGIFRMSWIAPLEVMETVNPNAQLMPFSKIIKIFEKLMLIKYESIPEWLDSRDFEIDRVVLSLQRIAEQDQPESGLLIPAWNFYGKRLDRQKDGNVSETVFTSFLSINAIDGTIIDIEKGY